MQQAASEPEAYLCWTGLQCERGFQFSARRVWGLHAEHAAASDRKGQGQGSSSHGAAMHVRHQAPPPVRARRRRHWLGTGGCRWCCCARRGRWGPGRSGRAGAAHPQAPLSAQRQRGGGAGTGRHSCGLHRQRGAGWVGGWVRLGWGGGEKEGALAVCLPKHPQLLLSLNACGWRRHWAPSPVGLRGDAGVACPAAPGVTGG